MNKIYLYLLRKPIWFKLTPFTGFIAKYVFKLENNEYIFGVNTKYLQEVNRFTGLDKIVEIIQSGVGDVFQKTEELKHISNENLAAEPICFEVSETIYKLFLETLEND